MLSKAKNTKGVYTSVADLLQLRYLARDLTLQARKESTALMAGTVRTRYRGRGMEFAEVRPYQAGDDVRTIDWRVTARVQAPYTKLFQEEHERPVFVLVDQRAPLFFGSRNQFKSVFAAEFAAVIAWAASNNNDRIGGLIFGDREYANIRARRGKHALLELFNQLTKFNTQLGSPISEHQGTSLVDMLRDTSRIARPGSLVVLISDYHDFTPACAEPLSLLARRSDVMAVHVFDPFEQALPAEQQLTISNNAKRLTIDTHQVGEQFAHHFVQQQRLIQQTCINAGVQYVSAPCDQDFEAFVRDLLHPRSGSRRKGRPARRPA